jgi:hypothetical protein
MTRSTVIVTACLAVLSIYSIGYCQDSDSLSLTPPDLRLYGVPDEAGNLKPMYAQVRYILTNHTDSTQIYRFFLNSNHNMFDEKGFRKIDSHDSTVLTFRSDQLLKSSKTDTLLFQYYPISDQSKMFQILSAVQYDSETEILPADGNDFRISPPYPNPFCATINFELYVPYTGFVVVLMADLNGEVIDTLLSGVRDIGNHRFVPKNIEKISSGIYLINAEFDGKYFDTQRFVLVQ